MPDIISNSSCLIALDNIGMLYVIKELYGEIYITEEVAKETGIDSEDWIVIRRVADKNYVKMLNSLIDLGEASTLALSFEFSDSVMILDDLKARKAAERLNLKFTGLLGVLLKAKEKQIIPSIREILGKLRTVGFRISEAVEKELLKLAEEQSDV